MQRIQRIAPSDVGAVVRVGRKYATVALTSGERVNLLEFEYRALMNGQTLSLQLFELD